MLPEEAINIHEITNVTCNGRVLVNNNGFPKSGRIYCMEAIKPKNNPETSATSPEMINQNETL